MLVVTANNVYEIRRMVVSDVLTLRLSSPESNLWGYLDTEKLDVLLGCDSWTGLVNNQIVACGGLVRVWPGLAEAWIAITPLAVVHKTFLYRHVKTFLTNSIYEFGLRRVQAVVRQDFHAAQRFAHHLGFTFNCNLEKYGPNGEDFILVSKVIT